MANNRLILCEVDDDNEIVNEMIIAKNMGGEWYCSYAHEKVYVDDINEFLLKAFINGNGISVRDEYMDVPLPPIHVYNDPYEGKGHWEFVRGGDTNDSEQA